MLDEVIFWLWKSIARRLLQSLWLPRNEQEATYPQGQHLELSLTPKKDHHMKSFTTLVPLFTFLFICHSAIADDLALKQRISDLEKRVTTLEKHLQNTVQKDLWKDAILWQRIKKEMNSNDISKLLGKPTRIEEQIFTTWYYHPTSKLHSFVWFDEGKVLGWEAPNK